MSGHCKEIIYRKKNETFLTTAGVLYSKMAAFERFKILLTVSGYIKGDDFAASEQKKNIKAPMIII